MPRLPILQPGQSYTFRQCFELQYTSLSSDQARRELLVAPIMTDLCHYTRSQLRIEYPLIVNDWLKGNLDYLVRTNNTVGTTHTLLVVEAKHDDLARSFTQLAAELIALNHNP